MNELNEHRYWLNRNWKWLIPVITVFLLSISLVFASPLGKKMSDIVKLYADPDLIENALLHAQGNEEVTILLGTLKPINKGAIVQGIIKYSNNDRTVDLYIHVNGSKGKGRMRVFADWNGENWEYRTISVINKTLKNPIMVLDKK